MSRAPQPPGRAVRAVKEAAEWLDLLGRHCCAGRSYAATDAVIARIDEAHARARSECALAENEAEVGVTPEQR